MVAYYHIEYYKCQFSEESVLAVPEKRGPERVKIHSFIQDESVGGDSGRELEPRGVHRSGGSVTPLLALLAFVCFFSNGALPSIQSYSCLPYGKLHYFHMGVHKVIVRLYGNIFVEKKYSKQNFEIK